MIDYTHLLSGLPVVAISLTVGMLIGSYVMFLLMYRTEKELLKELDHKNELLADYNHG